MQMIEKKYILTFLPLFKSIYNDISTVFSKLSSFIKFFISENGNSGSFLSNPAIIYSFKRNEFLKEKSPRTNKALNTATVYINGSNHNLVYVASACRLHPGPTLHMKQAFWRTTAGR
jgi:hypothetical protein